MSQSGLRKSPLQIAGQLYGRLMGYGRGNGGGGGNEGKKIYVKDIDELLKTVKAWKGPKGSAGWWCPKQQTYEPAGGKCLHTFVGHEGSVYCSAFSKDGTMIVSGSSDKTIRVWNVDTGECIFTLKGHTGGVTSVAFNHDGIQRLYLDRLIIQYVYGMLILVNVY